jgi:hypothetical protein
MAEPDLTNELVETLTQRRLTSAEQPKLDTLEENVSKPAEPSGRPPKNLLQFVGFPYEFSVDGLVRLFTTSSFDEESSFLRRTSWLRTLCQRARRTARGATSCYCAKMPTSSIGRGGGRGRTASRGVGASTPSSEQAREGQPPTGSPLDGSARNRVSMPRSSSRIWARL